MYEYIFLFVIAWLWALFASIQDVKYTEISDWLTFSLLIICLGYRGIFSVVNGNMNFFIFGVGGVVLFTVLSYLFYYGNFFAGGDAKLLIAFGAVLPFEKFVDYAVYGGGFVFALFVVGAVYSLIYSIFLVGKNITRFKKSFGNNFAKNKIFIYFALILAVIFIFLNYVLSISLLVMGFLFLYLKTVEESCMIRLVKPKDLMEGDWIVNDFKIGSRLIKKSVHGLTEEQISFIRKNGKSVIIRHGIPFAPCFFFTLMAFMVFFFLGQASFSALFSAFLP
jgi:Flp pilus assembly protein protease CpaA